jgi:hypothetical protein
MTANRLRRNRPIIGIATAVAGAAVLVGIVLAQVSSAFPFRWLFIASAVALVVAFAAAGSSGGFNDAGRLAFAAGAVGWFVYALSSVLSNVASIITEVGVGLALIGSLVAGLVVYARHSFGTRANSFFLLAMILTAAYLLVQIVPMPWLSSVIVVLLSLLWGASLVLAGLYILQRK